MFTNDDIKQIEQRGSSVQTVEEQVERFKKGFPWMKVVAPATPERGILVLDEEAVEAAGKYYDALSGERVVLDDHVERDIAPWQYQILVK